MIIPPRFIIEDDDVDLLRTFTAWVSKVVNYARQEYLRTLDRIAIEVPLDDAPVALLSYEDHLPISEDEFEFTEEKLSETFFGLSLLRRRILTYIYVDLLTPQEIADKLNCSADYVYLQKHRALKAMRDRLIRGGEDGGE